MNFAALAASIDAKAAPPMPSNAITAAQTVAPSNAAAPAATPAPSAASSASARSDREHDRRPARNNDRAPREFNRQPAAAASSSTAPAHSLSNFEPPTYPKVDHPKSAPKLMYSRAFLLKVARASKLIEVAPTGIMPELLKPLANAGPVHAPPAPAGSVPRTATKLGVPANASTAASSSKFAARDDVRASERDRPADRDRPAAGSERRWNDLREETRGGRNEREDRAAPREGMRDKYGRFEATPSWANTEVKSTLNDDDTFGGGGAAASSSSGGGGFFGNGIGGDFLFGKALDREADAKIMAQNGWGEMFRASEDLEKKAAEEREEIRRQMQQEADEADAGSGDFTELPPNHPLMLQKQRALDAAAAAARNAADASTLANAQSDDELAKLDELLAAKAAREAAAKKNGGLETVHEKSHSSSSSAPAASPPGFPSAVPTWAVPSAHRTDGPQHSSLEAGGEGRSKFASRFGFAMQEDGTSVATATSVPASTWGTGLGVADMSGAPAKSKWGFSLAEEDTPPVDQSMLAKFASTPNTIQKLPLQPHPHAQHQPQPQQLPRHHHDAQVQPQFVPVSVGALFQQASTNPMPSMPAASSVPLPAAAAAAIAAEDPLQRLVSKHRNRKATGVGAPVGGQPQVLTAIQQQHMLQQAGNVGGPGIYQQGVAAGLSNRYDAAAQQQQQQQAQQTRPMPQARPQLPASMLQNPAFLALPAAQQQQYAEKWMRQWEESQPRQPQQQPQLPQQPQQQQGVPTQSHYVSVQRPPATGFPGQPGGMMTQQQQPQQVHPPQSQPLPPGMLRRPMMQNPQSVQQGQQGPSPNASQSGQLPAHLQHAPPSSMMYQQHAGQPQHHHAPHVQQHQQPPQQMRTAPPNYGGHSSSVGVPPQPSAAPPASTGGGGLDRWFGHLAQTQLPAVPQGAVSAGYPYQQQQQQQPHLPQQQRR